jgi:hypothetical protein
MADQYRRFAWLRGFHFVERDSNSPINEDFSGPRFRHCLCCLGLSEADHLNGRELNMKLTKFAGFLGLGALALGTVFALQGCVEATPGYGPAYAYNNPGYVYNPRPVYVAPAPVYPNPRVGDWDEHHQWHDRDWWEDNRRPWAEEHHPEWFPQRHASHENHDHQEGRDRD